VATLRQLLREYGRRLPCLAIRDYPDFGRRGVMLDISRGRVPNLGTLLALLDHLADFKINEFQLYTEHTFAYRDYEPVWRDWGALTGDEILLLDARARALGIDLVPNQNSFGHLRYWLEYPPLKKLAEVGEPYEDGGGAFLRYPGTLAPNYQYTLRFLRGLYDELLPHFTSPHFNVGCDETWDLGRGQSKALCASLGKGRVYAGFLKKIHREVASRGRRMMFWGDIILHYPELIEELPVDVIALNWGYEAGHPWEREAGAFAKSKMPFYVCPGTSTWMSLLGRHDNSFVNLREAAEAGLRHGAVGYLNTDWGDGGHPQPLAVSYAPFVLGAALSWCAQTCQEKFLAPVLSRDVFQDPTQRMAEAALALGVAHRRFDFYEANVTPFGAVIAAPKPGSRELFCRNGLKYYAQIPAKNIRAALGEVEKQRAVLGRARTTTRLGEILGVELDLAARMAAQSCRFMLWQQARAAGTGAGVLARTGLRELRELDRDFRDYWPARNKGTTEKCSPFLKWRMEAYGEGRNPKAEGRGKSENRNP
jgi:hexosaminidase